MDEGSDRIIVQTRRLVAAHVQTALSGVLDPQTVEELLPGKMLRTRLAARIAEATEADAAFVACACAAAEIVHSASLCHDDVIDNALVRRGTPTLWRRVGPTAAVLIGDLLLARAFEVALKNGADCARRLSSATLEMAAAEAEQEMLEHGPNPDAETCLRLARGKTGALFAFACWACAPEDPARAAALERAGYSIGTAYQLADDLLDVVGSEQTAKKTLGTDHQRRTPSLASIAADPFAAVQARVTDLCQDALSALDGWPQAPAVRRAAETFLALDLQPVLDRQVPGLSAAPGK